ncbi:hypothetical protein NDU88_006270 [Pleurodeles waltl]|uniref:Uncharacterized protein n=1 Tax=Pleurodeles waltl TaxID=8319 RepID=A0AAV7LNP6_PLEWA|nr:hypothetical protein NDU88_006270 [Pleurodeles waltl]
MVKTLTALQAKVQVLEALSRRNNLRVVGIAETILINNMEEYIKHLLTTLVGRETFSDIFIVERAHRSLAPQLPPGAPLRLVLAKILKYRDRDAALRKARELKTLRHEGSDMSFTMTSRNRSRKHDDYFSRR